MRKGKEVLQAAGHRQLLQQVEELVRWEEGVVFSELGWTPLKPLRLSLPVIGYYKDEVIDQSDEVVRALSAIKVAGANLGPTMRWTFHPAWWVEGQAAGERKRFDEGVNNFDIGEGALRLGWKPSKRLKVRLGAEQRWRNYAERSQISAAGRERQADL